MPNNCQCPCHEHGIVCIDECKCGSETTIKGDDRVGLWIIVIDPSSKLHEIRTADGNLEIYVDNIGVVHPDLDVVAQLFQGWESE